LVDVVQQLKDVRDQLRALDEAKLATRVELLIEDAKKVSRSKRFKIAPIEIVPNPETIIYEIEVWRSKPICFCERPHRDLVLLPAVIPLLDSPADSIQMGVYECPGCRRLFISESTVKAIEGQFGYLLFVPLEPRTSRKSRDESQKFNSNWNAESILKRFGYSASQQNDPGTLKRIQIIRMLIKTNQATPEQLERHLGWLAGNRGHRMPYANDLWQSDIAYINGLTQADVAPIAGRLVHRFAQPVS
jgi:hypothetical protein